MVASDTPSAGEWMNASSPNQSAFVSVIMPVRNEQDFIERSLGAVLRQKNLTTPPQVILVDGESDDGTVAVALETARRVGAEIEVVTNPDRSAPSALNIGLARAEGRVICRVDGHCQIPPDYLSRCLTLLQSTGADCVGGVCVAEPTTEMGEAIAAAMASPLGMGGVAFRSPSQAAGAVDTLAFGAYQRAVFQRIGGFDEELVRNQDDEFNFRLTQTGGTIWLDPSLMITYWARERLGDLFRQFRGYGTYKVRVFQKRGAVPKARHLAPLGLIAALTTSAVSSLVHRRPWILLATVGGYMAVIGIAAGQQGGGWARTSRMAAAMMTMHLAYGIGSVEGIWRWRTHFSDTPTEFVSVELGWTQQQEQVQSK